MMMDDEQLTVGTRDEGDTAASRPPYLSKKRGRNLALYALIFFLALAPRLGNALHHGGDPLGGDEPEYDALAWGLSQTGAYTSQPGFSLAYYSPSDFAPTAFRAPVFPATLAAVYSLFGHRTLPARLVLVGIGSLSALLVFLLALELIQDRRAALLAALAWALWPAAVYQLSTASSNLGTEGVAVALVLLGLWMLALSLRRPSLLLVAGGGAVLGLCALTRSNLLLVAAFSVPWLAYAWWRSRGARRALLGAAVLGAAFLAVVLPWVARNYAVVGAPTIATQTDVLFFGNNAWARGSYNSEGGKLFEVIAPYRMATLSNLSRLAAGGDMRRAASSFLLEQPSEQYRYLEERHPGLLLLTEAEKSGIYRQEGLKCIAGNGRRMLWLVYRKALLFWLPLHETRSGSDYSYMYAFMLPFFAVGAWRAVVKRRDWLLLLAPVLACFATVIIAFGHPRYRFPAEPAMVILAAAGVAALARRYSWGRVTAVAAVWFIINVGMAFALLDNGFGL
jgi:4-amino-4-deoxy-L-arabinose transferase-like glycosyltransferase